MKKRIIFTLVMFLGSICISGILAESFMRLFYEPRSILNLDEIKDILWNYVYTPPTNKMGFREAELSDEVFQDDYRRILFLGDSFTYGHGVKKGEDRFSDIIENRLNEATNSFKYHIYNAGVSATKPRRWVRYLRKLLPVYKPQYVFAIFFLRDGTNLLTSLSYHQKKIKGLKAKYENNFWYKYTHVGKYIANKLAEREFTDDYLNEMTNSYLGNETQRKPWVAQQKHLLKIRHMCNNRKIKFHLVIFPLLYGLESDYQFYDIEKEITRFAKENGISIFSLTKGFVGQESKSLWVAPGDQHPNEKGHLIAADTLYPYLREALK